MRKKTGIKICVVVSVLLVLFCIVVGRMTAGSYIDNVELEQYLANQDVTVAYCGMGYDPVTNRGYMDNDEIQSVDDLIAKDVVIVKVRLNGDFQRKLYYECILSKIDIVKCYKGNLKEGDSIHIFEPVDCGFEEQMLCTDGYSMMQPDKEYILFLKTLKNTYFGSDKYIYAPCSTRYSKYQVDGNKPKFFSYEELEETESLHLYSEIKEQEVYLYEKEDYEKYLKLKSEVLEKYQ
jgi:hypothetical protein